MRKLQDPSAFVKCKLCPWKTWRWRTNKAGRKINNYPRLENHFMMEHPDEYQSLILKSSDIEYFEEVRLEDET